MNLFPELQVIGGASYDHVRFPSDIDTPPIAVNEKSVDQVSPKAGLLWSPTPDTHFRAAYTRSLGGVFFDNSVRLEPVQIAGFDQAFRSIAPESAVGIVPGTRFVTFTAWAWTSPSSPTPTSASMVKS